MLAGRKVATAAYQPHAAALNCPMPISKTLSKVDLFIPAEAFLNYSA